MLYLHSTIFKLKRILYIKEQQEDIALHSTIFKLKLNKPKQDE